MLLPFWRPVRKLLRSALSRRGFLGLNLLLVIFVVVLLLHTAAYITDLPQEKLFDQIKGPLNHKSHIDQERPRDSNLLHRPWKNVEEVVNSSAGIFFHEYPEHVDLRILVLTYSRSSSLQQVLDSLQLLKLDGDRAIIEVWIDRSKSGSVHKDTLRVAREFQWEHGSVRVHIHGKHVGLYGQWIYTWRPRIQDSLSRNELALYLEDDTDVSPYAYRWLRACYEFYKHREDVSGFGLQDQNAKLSSGEHMQEEVIRPKKDPVFLYRIPGSWGFAPHPDRWREFQDWYMERKDQKKYKPYVSRARLHTMWYRTFEKHHKADTMWTMWYIRFTYERHLYAFYSNLPTLTGRDDVSLVSNRREPGLHFNPKFNQALNFTIPKLMMDWNDRYVQFSLRVHKYDYDGIEINT